jgi:hypothetical protein
MRRLAAAGELKDKTISAFVRKMDDQQAIIAQWVENNERLDPSPIDSAIDGDTLTLAGTECVAEFFDFLVDRIPDLYAAWAQSRDQAVNTSPLMLDGDT